MSDEFPIFRRQFGRVIGRSRTGDRIVGFAYFADGSYSYACLEPHGRDPLGLEFSDAVWDEFALRLYLHCGEFRDHPRRREVGELLQNWPESNARDLERALRPYGGGGGCLSACACM